MVIKSPYNKIGQNVVEIEFGHNNNLTPELKNLHFIEEMPDDHAPSDEIRFENGSHRVFLHKGLPRAAISKTIPQEKLFETVDKIRKMLSSDFDFKVSTTPYTIKLGETEFYLKKPRPKG